MPVTLTDNETKLIAEILDSECSALDVDMVGMLLWYDTNNLVNVDDGLYELADKLAPYVPAYDPSEPYIDPRELYKKVKQNEADEVESLKRQVKGWQLSAWLCCMICVLLSLIVIFT